MTGIRRVPHCSHWGGYTVLVDDGKIVGIEPLPDDPHPSPIIQSVRQWAEPELRVLRPMVREGWLRKRHESDRSGRGSERFIPVGWDEAADLVAGEIDRVRDEFGNASIFAGSYGWTSCGRFHHAATLLKRTLNLVGGYTGHVDTYSLAAGPVILRHAVGSEDVCYGQGTTLDTVVDHTETLVVFGALSPRTAQNEAGGIAHHGFETYLKRIAGSGKKIILVSPLRDDVPDWLECEWWPVRPGADAALMIGLAGEIVLAGRHDRAFLSRCCSGAYRFLAYLDGSADGVRKNAAWAARITGLDASRIRGLAPVLVDTRSMLTVSWSLQRARHGEQPYWAALALAAIAGQIGLPGGGVGYGYGSVAGIGGPYGAGRSPSMSQLAKPLDSFIPVSRITDMLLNPGAAFTYEGKTRHYPDTRLVYWAGGNPYHHHQDLNRLAEAWARPETIVVQDPMWTATAQRADIVLPASTSLERNDLAGSQRTSRILAMHKAIAPLGQARSDFEIFNDLASRLGVAEAFNEGRDEMGWIRHLYERSREQAAARAGFEMPEFDLFWKRGHADVPLRGSYTFLGDFRQDPATHALKTESGRIVIGSDLLARLAYEDCPAHPAWIEPPEWLGSAGEDEFHLISNQPVGRLHSQIATGVTSRMQKRNGREQARINPADATRLGLRDGATVRLWNARGACLATATLDDGVRPNVVVLPTGAWYTPTGNDGLEIAGNPNILTPDLPTSAFGQGCSAYTCIVRIEPYEGSVPDALDHYQRNIGSLSPAAPHRNGV